MLPVIRPSERRTEERIGVGAMYSSINFGFPPRPLWTRSWFDRLLVKFHITPFHIRRYMKDIMYIELLLEDIARRCHNIGLHYSITVDWENECVSFKQLRRVANTSLCQEISFYELLGDDFDPHMFVSSRLLNKKR